MTAFEWIGLTIALIIMFIIIQKAYKTRKEMKKEMGGDYKILENENKESIDEV